MEDTRGRKTSDIEKLDADVRALRREQREQREQHARLQTEITSLQGLVRERREFQDRLELDQRAMRREIGDLRESITERVRREVAHRNRETAVPPSDPPKHTVPQHEMDYRAWNAMRDGVFDRAMKRLKP
jgi:chromosome segregation ATPase